jgi:hypothetical protein
VRQVEHHPKRAVIEECRAVLTATWTPLLAALSHVLSGHVDEETHQVILRVFQSFITMASTLDLVGPRCVHTRGRACAPTGTSQRGTVTLCVCVCVHVRLSPFLCIEMRLLAPCAALPCRNLRIRAPSRVRVSTLSPTTIFRYDAVGLPGTHGPRPAPLMTPVALHPPPAPGNADRLQRGAGPV